jgi:hypothetical protein
MLIRKLNDSNIRQLFPSMGYLTRAIIAEYRASDVTTMDYHRDVSLDEYETISVIMSLSDATASVQMSNRNDGSYNGDQRQLFYYPVYHNSVYAFVGSYATHGVESFRSGNKNDRRYAFVFFFSSQLTKVMASCIWQRGFDSKDKVLMCDTCMHNFHYERFYKSHICK